jgi:1,2-diacylglycerol 3-alpha-glucosyltransferase
LIPQIAAFQPDVVHAHHPFLLGTSGQAIASAQNVPLVYTHHTRYSVYIETKTNWPRAIEDAIIELVINYCGLCDTVIAPSEGIRHMLREAGVSRPIEVLPTGVDCERFVGGDGVAARRRLGIPENAFVIGHVGRLAPEKNCQFLAQATGEFLRVSPEAWLLIVGTGSEMEGMREVLQGLGVIDRVCFAGLMQDQELVDAYSAMNVFAFASHSETQGMVLTEAMAAGLLVVAVRGTGVNDLIQHEKNGWVVAGDNVEQFVTCLKEAQQLTGECESRTRAAIRATVEENTMRRCAERLVEIYQHAIDKHREARSSEDPSHWDAMLRTWAAAWDRWVMRAKAVRAATAGLARRDPSSPGI